MFNSCTLALGGAFNPIHTQHIEIMKIAKDYLEKERKFSVKEAYFAVAHEGYLQSKMKGKQIIKSEHRINMVNLAASKYEWLKPVDKCYGSAFECLIEKCMKNELKVIVVGADRAVSGTVPKWRKKSQQRADIITLIIGRPGETEMVKKLWNDDIANGIIVSDSCQYFFINIETNDISSTKIREILISSLDKEKSLLELSGNNFLDKSVADYMIANEQTLFK